MIDVMMLAAAVLAVPAPEPVGPVPAVVVVAEQPRPVDPTRLGEARKLVGLMMSDEMIARMFGGMQNAMRSSMIARFMPPGEIEKARVKDPAFDQRFDRIMGVTMRIVGEVMREIAPEMREAMATLYARNETLDQLHAQAAFVATPPGKAMLETMYNGMSDPAYVALMGSVGQRMAERMKTLPAEIEAATKDLPPPPRPDPAQAAKP